MQKLIIHLRRPKVVRTGIGQKSLSVPFSYCLATFNAWTNASILPLRPNITAFEGRRLPLIRITRLITHGVTNITPHRSGSRRKLLIGCGPQ